jgi:hypothetical protein
MGPIELHLITGPSTCVAAGCVLMLLAAFLSLDIEETLVHILITIIHIYSVEFKLILGS